MDFCHTSDARLIEGFDEKLYRDIAGRCNSEQLKRDIGFAMFLYHHTPALLLAKRIEDIGFYLVKMKKSEFYLFGLGVVAEHQGKGLARVMLQDVVETASLLGYGTLKMKTTAGLGLYQHVLGAKIVSGGYGGLYTESKCSTGKRTNFKITWLIINHRVGATRADCSMPMTFDTYSNCGFGCIYCFSQFQRAIGGAKESYLHKVCNSVNVERIKKMFTDPDQYAGQFAPYIKARKVMQWGGLSDQFDGFERQRGVTLELLRFFKEINYPLCFSTKSTWWTQDERYMELVRGQKNWNFKFSIITLDEEKARIIERGVPTPLERLAAIERIANSNSGGATLRLRPFIIGVSTPSYLDLIREASNRGATAMSTEFMCVEQRSQSLREWMPTFNELCGFDFMEFYRKYSVSSGYLRLNRKVKEPFMRNMKALCEELGMRFYVSDAHFKELCCNGSCCGLPADWNYSKGQFCEALQIAKKAPDGRVKWDDIRAEIEQLVGGFQWHSASGYNCNSSERRAKFAGMTMADYMRWLWNNPQAGQSPYKLFEGALIPDGQDENGNLVYKYNGAKF